MKFEWARWWKPTPVVTPEDEQLKAALRQQAEELERRLVERVVDLQTQVTYGRRRDDVHRLR